MTGDLPDDDAAAPVESAGSVIAIGGFSLSVLLIVLRPALGPQWAAEGVFMLFAVLFTFIGAQFIGMGLLGEYIGRIYNDVRARPRYFVQQVIYRKARRLLRKVTNESRYFCLSRYGMSGRAGRTGCRV